MKNRFQTAVCRQKILIKITLIFFAAAFSCDKLLLAEEWEIKEGVTVQRYCRGGEVRYSNSPPKDFQLCLDSADKGSFNKMKSASDVIQKDFSDDGKATEMTADERRRMARDLRSIQEKRAKEAPQDLVKELNKFLQSWEKDPKFKKEMMEGLSPEERLLLEKFPFGSIQIMKDLLKTDLRKQKGSR